MVTVRLLPLLFCMTSGVGWAEVYTWVDENGMTHYSDRPPAQGNANVVDLGSQPMSTMGASGLRPGEQEMLRQIEEKDKAEAAARAAAASAPPPPAPVVIERPPRRETSTSYILPWNYYPWPYPGQHWHNPPYGVDFQLNFGNGHFHYGHDRPPNYVAPWPKPRPPLRPRPALTPPPSPTSAGMVPRPAFAPGIDF